MKLIALLAALTLGSFLAACSSPSTTPAPIGPQAWKIAAGGSTLSEAVQAVDFYPNTITINEGDTITWTLPAAIPHTISIPPAGQMPGRGPAPAGGPVFDGTTYVSSGFQIGGTYSITFTKAGTYKAYCVFHQPEMTATIVVQPAGSALPMSQAQYDAIGATDLGVDLNAGVASIQAFPFTPGGTIIATGIQPGGPGAPPADATVVRFMNDKTVNQNVTVAVGTTLTWRNISQLPHTVTFPVVGQSIPPGSPDRPAAGGSTYDGSVFTHSGTMYPGASYSLTFTKPGVYTYTCLFHDGAGGMIGTVTVQ